MHECGGRHQGSTLHGTHIVNVAMVNYVHAVVFNFIPLPCDIVNEVMFRGSIFNHLGAAPILCIAIPFLCLSTALRSSGKTVMSRSTFIPDGSTLKLPET